MSKVFVALAVSVDGYITGRDPGAGRGLGDGSMLFDWYFDGDTPSQVFDGFRLSEPSARVFDAIAGRVGVSLAGRNTYDDSGWEHGGTPAPDRAACRAQPPADACERPADAGHDRDRGRGRGRAGRRGRQGRRAHGGRRHDRGLAAGLVDEVILHQVPILLGGGRPFFQSLP